jgi:Biopterin-dependent aromatic amino acid hydroxylase
MRNAQFPITSYQPCYFVAGSLGDAKQKMRRYCEVSMHHKWAVPQMALISHYSLYLYTAPRDTVASKHRKPMLV